MWNSTLPKPRQYLPTSNLQHYSANIIKHRMTDVMANSRKDKEQVEGGGNRQAQCNPILCRI